MSTLTKQSAQGAFFSLLGGLVGFVTTFFITTKVLTPEEIGLIRLLIEVATLLSGFALLATQSSAIRYYPHFRDLSSSAKGHAERRGEGGFLKLWLMLVLVGLALCTILYLLLRGSIIRYFAVTDGWASLFQYYYYAVLPLMLCLTLQTMMEVYCSLRQRIAVPKLLREVVQRLLHLMLYIVMAVSAMHFSFFVALFVLAYGLITLLCVGYGISLTPSALREPIKPISPPLGRDFAKYTCFTLASALGGSIISRLDLFMVSSQMGLEHSGIYTIAFFIVAVMEMPSRSITALHSPLVSQAMNEGNRAGVMQLFQKVATQQLLSGSILFLIIWSNIDLLFALIPNGDVYQAGKWVVFFLGIGRLLDLTFSFGNAILRYSKHFVWTLAYTLITTVATILFNLYLIEQMGITGAAIGTLFTYLLSYTFQQVILRRRVRVELPHGELPQIVVSLLLLLVVCESVGYALAYLLSGPLSLEGWGGLAVYTLAKNGILLLLGGYLLTRLKSFQELWQEVKQRGSL